MKHSEYEFSLKTQYLSKNKTRQYFVTFRFNANEFHHQTHDEFAIKILHITRKYRPVLFTQVLSYSESNSHCFVLYYFSLYPIPLLKRLKIIATSYSFMLKSLNVV